MAPTPPKKRNGPHDELANIKGYPMCRKRRAFLGSGAPGWEDKSPHRNTQETPRGHVAKLQRPCTIILDTARTEGREVREVWSGTCGEPIALARVAL